MRADFTEVIEFLPSTSVIPSCFMGPGAAIYRSNQAFASCFRNFIKLYKTDRLQFTEVIKNAIKKINHQQNSIERSGIPGFRQTLCKYQKSNSHRSTTA